MPRRPSRTTRVKHIVPGSKASFTETGANDRFNVPDWYPGRPSRHARHRRAWQGKPDVLACGYCHLPTGQGRPENALAGRPARRLYREQIADMREGRRKSSSDKMGSINAMMAIAKAVPTTPK